MTTLPRHVQKQLDQANALEAQLAQQAEQAVQPAQSVEAFVAPPPPDVIPDPVSPTPPAPAAPVAPKDDFEHKYRVLQGMYEADVKRVKANQAALEQRLASLEQAPPPAPAEPNPKDVETFGADLVAMVQRNAEALLADVVKRVVALEQNVGIVNTQTQSIAKKSFFAELTSAVPDFEAINADPRWLAWLGETDGLFNIPRQAALDDAQARGDAARVASFFNAFKASLPAAPAPEPGLSQQVVPSTTGSPAPQRRQVKPTISEKAVNAFYNDVARGKYAGRDAEMNALAAEIDLAVAEGRVVH